MIGLGPLLLYIIVLLRWAGLSGRLLDVLEHLRILDRKAFCSIVSAGFWFGLEGSDFLTEPTVG